MKVYWNDLELGEVLLEEEALRLPRLSEDEVETMLGHLAPGLIEGEAVLPQETCLGLMLDVFRRTFENVELLAVHAHHHLLAAPEEKLRLRIEASKRRRFYRASFCMWLERERDEQIVSDAEFVVRLWADEYAEARGARPAVPQYPTHAWEASLPFPANRVALDEALRGWVQNPDAARAILNIIDELPFEEDAVASYEVEAQLCELADQAVRPLPAYAQGDDDHAFRLVVSKEAKEFLLKVGPVPSECADAPTFDRAYAEMLARTDQFIQDLEGVWGAPDFEGHELIQRIEEGDERVADAGRILAEEIGLGISDVLACWEKNDAWAYVALQRQEPEYPVLLVAGVQKLSGEPLIALSR